ncbi:MAG: hypothetical protein EOM10_15640 [Opitutae bacterium]|nr:hypothetical protein [Opitutae bacterium]
MSRAAITLVRDAPFTLGNHPLFLGCYRFRPTMASSPEDVSLSFCEEMQKHLGGDAHTTPQDPSEADIARAMAMAKGHTSLVVGTYNGRLRPGQLALARAAAQSGLPVCVIALRNPYDLAGLPPTVRTLAAYDYDRRTLPILAQVLCGAMDAPGRLPVRLEA